MLMLLQLQVQCRQLQVLSSVHGCKRMPSVMPELVCQKDMPL